MPYISISTTCEECGSKVALLITELPPTEYELIELEKSLGGMFCIKTVSKEITDGINLL